MKFAVIYSKKDEAGTNIANHLREHFLPQMQLIEVAKESIFNENIDESEELKSTDFIIFATKHQSKEQVPSLSLHAPGNWRNADFGGKPGKISKTSSLMMKFLFQKLEENAKNENYQHKITLECTHHGPLLNTKPCCFIELGSSIEGWNDKQGARIVAKTIADFQNFEKWKSENKNIKSTIGIGGPHYCPNFNKIQLNNHSIAIGHIIPEYSFPITETMLKESIEKTQEHLDIILVDWKGCGNSESRQQIIKIIESLGLEHERTERMEK
jgi:D-aminoacyl-tRNA deacylase